MKKEQVVNMKISYQREFKHNYLIIDTTELLWQGYECHMMAQNQIDGILRFQIRQMDDGVRFYYEITSKQPLARILENRSIQAEEIWKLMIGIFGVLERMEAFLLSESSILLEPEYLYVNSDTFRVWLCLIPGLKRKFPEDFSRFLEYLLEKVDHQDKESVVLAYSLYQETRKENYGMEDVMRLLQREKDSQFCQEEGKEEEQEDCKSNQQEKEIVRQKESSPSGWKILWEKWKQRLFKRNKREKEIVPVRVPWEMMFQEEESAYEPEVFKNHQPEAAPKKEGKELMSADISQGTVLLADFSTKSQQRVLRALDSIGTDIPIPYYPFIIGKQENLVDFKLDKETVSRLHLKIDQKEERYFIQDLNSTNGTMLCGRLLENNEEAELFTGDEISIAGYRYRFE
ncbi:FHA domain-containing protein [Clostridiaceae bacterium]|nr:FHA domain-containing protein [Clostridiaceae bacterium]